MDKYLIIFVERERISEEGFEEFHRLYRNFENERSQIFQVFKQRLNAVD